MGFIINRLWVRIPLMVPVFCVPKQVASVPIASLDQDLNGLLLGVDHSGTVILGFHMGGNPIVINCKKGHALWKVALQM